MVERRRRPAARRGFGPLDPERRGADRHGPELEPHDPELDSYLAALAVDPA